MTRAFSLVSVLLPLAACATLPVRADAPLNRQVQPALKDVRLEGKLAAKTDRLLARRVTDDFMRQTIFDEARRAFVAAESCARRSASVSSAGGSGTSETKGSFSSSSSSALSSSSSPSV